MTQVMAAVRGRSILTVSDVEGFSRSLGGMIRLLTEENKIKFRINIYNTTAEHLVVDARLLRMADIVRER